MALENTDLLVAYRVTEQKHYKVKVSEIKTGTQNLDQVLNIGNVSDKNIELTNGNDLIHLTPNENRVLIAGSALSDTPRLVLANADNNIATDNQFTLQLGDSSTKAEFTSSANIPTIPLLREYLLAT